MQDLSQIKAKLTAMQTALSNRANRIEGDLHEPADDDWSEEASEAAGDEVLEAVGTVTADEIAQIHAALRRLEAGQYGICVQCGEPIAERRLEALPYAARCVRCVAES